MSATTSTDPYTALRQNAAERRHRPRKALLDELTALDDVLINISTERDMSEAYYKTLEAHLRDGHGCVHDFTVVADGLSAEELDPGAPWNAVDD